MINNRQPWINLVRVVAACLIDIQRHETFTHSGPKRQTSAETTRQIAIKSFRIDWEVWYSTELVNSECKVRKCKLKEVRAEEISESYEQSVGYW